MARVFSLVELVGVLLVVLWVVLPDDQVLDRGWVSVVAAVASVQALVLRHARWELPLGALSGMLGFASAIVGMLVYLSGGALSPIALFYVWVVAYSAWYLPRPHTLIHVVWIVVSYLAMMLAYPEVGRTDWWQISNSVASRWLLLAGSVTATAFMVRTFRNTFLDHEQQFLLGFEHSTTPMALASLERRLSRVNDAFCALLGRAAHELVGISVTQLIDPSQLETTKPFLDSATDQAALGAFETRLMAADGRAVWVHVARSLVTDHRGRPLHYFAQILDITARRDAERQLQRRAGRQEAIADIGQSALGGAEAGDLGDQVVAAAAKHLGADLVAILEKDSSSDRFHLIAWRDSRIAHLNESITAGPDSLPAFTLATDATVFVEDWDTEARFHKQGLEFGRPVRSAISVLVRGRKHPYGVLVAQSEQPHAFTPDDETFLRALANMLAEAIDGRRAQQEIAHLALHDPLTGLANRTLFEDRLRHALAGTLRLQRSLAVLFLDVDDFKTVNDSLGHPAGDALLQSVAARIDPLVRPTDTTARLGGDEFAVLLDGVDSDQEAQEIAVRILDTLSDPFLIDERELNVTASIGVALSDGTIQADELLRNSDMAMYAAKASGKNSVRPFAQTMHRSAVERLELRTELPRALENREFYLDYQPIVSLQGNAMVGVEALVRWQHPTRGRIAPGQFIGLAEETGLIVALGRWILEQACMQVGEWERALPQARPLYVSVNVSIRQLQEDDFPDVVAEILTRTALNPQSLVLEITEGLLADNPEAIVARLQRLKRLGLRIAVDDFGTGYSALSHLQQFPIDILKIDKSFVDELHTNTQKANMVRGIINIAESLALDVIAEGIEQPQQADLLRTMRSPLGQGFFFSRPVGPDEILTLLARNQRTSAG